MFLLTTQHIRCLLHTRLLILPPLLNPILCFTLFKVIIVVNLFFLVIFFVVTINKVVLLSTRQKVFCVKSTSFNFTECFSNFVNFAHSLIWIKSLIVHDTILQVIQSTFNLLQRLPLKV